MSEPPASTSEPTPQTSRCSTAGAKRSGRSSSRGGSGSGSRPRTHSEHSQRATGAKPTVRSGGRYLRSVKGLGNRLDEPVCSSSISRAASITDAFAPIERGSPVIASRTLFALVRASSSLAVRSCPGSKRFSCEPLDELERRLGDLAPAVVDRERVTSIRHLHDLGHAGVVPLPLVGGVRDRPRHGVILLAVDDQQGTAVGVLRVHL